MKQNLDISQRQKTLQHLSPQQVQFVRLLEMNTPEIEEKVRREIDDNPALEARESHESDTAQANETADGETFSESSEQLQNADYRSDEERPFDRHYNAPNGHGNDVSMDINADTVSPTEDLLSQLADYDLTFQEKRAAQYIIGNLDANGRLTRPLQSIADDIAIATGDDISMQSMRNAFDAIRSMEPAGIGATDLRDCLLLQLERRPRSLAQRVATEIVDKHFGLLTHKYYSRMQSAMGISEDTLREALDFIRSLNPKPWTGAESDTDERMRHVTADFLVERLDDGRFSVSLTQRLPSLDIEQSFAVDSVAGNKDQSAIAFIRRKRDEAEGFISLLQRRTDTLLSVMRAIVTLQPDFFTTEETSAIRPMILRDIAARTGLDLSVISRATAGKYVATGGGIYPLKLFFNEKPKEDADASSHQIRQVIRDIIDTEDGSRPLSDDSIAEIMTRQGYDIARRTVAKYRERMGIPVARLRRKI